MRTHNAVVVVAFFALALAFSYSDDLNKMFEQSTAWYVKHLPYMTTEGLFDPLTRHTLPHTLIAAAATVTFIGAVVFVNMEDMLRDAKTNVRRVFIFLRLWLGLFVVLIVWLIGAMSIR